jgi:formate-dependent nitrite reductase membrane component NrfD
MIQFWQLPFMIAFATTGTVIYIYLRNQHKEKLELIKKGESIRNLANGIIAVSLALGIFIAHILETYTSLEPIVSYISMILLFFGIGSLTFYAIIKNK